MKTHRLKNIRLAVSFVLCVRAILPAYADDFLFTAIGTSHGLTDNEIRYISQLPDGRMVFTTTESSNLYDGIQFTGLLPGKEAVYPLKQYDGFHRVYQSTDSLLWIKDYRRLMCINLPQERYLHDIDNYFRQKGIRKPVDDLYADHLGRVWLICAGELRQPELGFCLELSPNRGNIQDLSADDEHLYLFYDTGEVSCHDIASKRLLYTRAAYPESEREKFRRTSLVIRSGNGFYQLRNGSKGGFFHFDPNRRTWTKIMEKDYTLNTLMISADKKAYISCVRGFWIIDLPGGTQQYLPSLRTRQGNVLATEISTVFQDLQGALWLGTFNRGLLYYHPAMYQVIHIDKKDFPVSLEENTSSTNFTEDRSGNVFVKDRSSIYKLDIQEESGRMLVPVTAASLPKEQQGEYGSGAAFVSHDGTLYFGESGGCRIFRPNPPSRFTDLPYPPVFTAFLVHGERIVPGRKYGNRTILSEATPYTKALSLNHDQNFITFEFSALNYFSPEYTYYRYQLEGIDAQWVQAGNAKPARGILQAPYTNLPPGNYTFKVMASADAKHWNEQQTARIKLMIHAPWWKTDMAYAGYAILSLVLIVAGARLSIYLTKKEMERKHKEEILLLRIRNLIEQCNRYEAEQKKLSEEGKVTAPPRHDTPPQAEGEQDTAESAFLTKAIKLVEENLHVPGYSVEQLSRDLCMERTGLYRKLVAMLDQSPSLFIRNIRLQRAAQLLAEGDLSITEIAERTGFSSTSYLSKCFQEMYGCRPSEYAEKLKKST